MSPSDGHLAGKQLQPSEIAALCYKHGWRDKNLIIAVAVCLSESDGYIEAYNSNLDDEGNVLSKDIGLFQINIPASKVGSSYEKRLFDPENNLRAARDLFDRRGFQPWYGYTKGVATNPDWYYWSEKRLVWAPSGRRIHKAIRGVANFWALEFGIESPKDVLLDFRNIPPKPENGT
jgi:hypothetical protein